MADILSLNAEARQEIGSKAAAKMRKDGRVPAIVYGHKQEPTPISLDYHDFVEGLHHGSRLLEIQLGKTGQKVLVKDLQYDHLGKEIVHADLVRVDVRESVTVEVPIELKGTAKGAEEGGIIEQHTDHLEVECKVTEIPESLVVSVRDMEVGDVLHARDIELPPGVKLISDPEMLMVTCSVVTTKTPEEMEEEAPAAPEVIGEEEKAEEQAEAGEQEEK
jgi:large subunit ribosomal protein L25